MGYHKKSIADGEYGKFSKIREEFEELQDAVEQKNKILILCELSDLVGAIKGYAASQGVTLEDVVKFMELTDSAFEDGTRPRKDRNYYWETLRQRGISPDAEPFHGTDPSH